MSDPPTMPPKAPALFSVGNKVQISMKLNSSMYRGQTGIINKVRRNGGSGSLKIIGCIPSLLMDQLLQMTRTVH